MTSKSCALLVGVVVVALVACGDFTGPKATLATFADSAALYSLNGAPPGAPNAIYLFGETAVHADPSFRFDIAFDIDSSGNIIILPVRTVASGLSSAHSVGVQTVPDNFDSLMVAPKTGYHFDSTLVVRPHNVVAIQSNDPVACGVSISGTALYAKLVIDAADPKTRQIKARFVVDPNCGFRSFQSGVPSFVD